ncbi:MAG: histone deacetylase [Nitrospiraceae bacterium]|nr:histone deacetylase [Nitrospiraceae bacterium]
MKKVGFYYDDIFLEHKNPPGHPESEMRLTAVIEALKRSRSWDKLIHVNPRRATADEILAVHSRSYYERALTFTGYFDPDTYISPQSVEAAHFAAGAVADAVERCKSGEIDRAFCAVRPPGHHAEADRAMGFCIFNNVAVAARHARKLGYPRVFIVDFDVHHGNGTQHTFEEDDTVYYFSTHEYPHYPGTGSSSEKGKGKGEGFTRNIPMEHGAGDAEYYTAYHDILPGVVRDFSPDIMIVSAGYDVHASDPLSGLQVSNEGIRTIVRSILSSAKDLPCVFSLEGGYSLAALRESVIITVEELYSRD